MAANVIQHNSGVCRMCREEKAEAQFPDLVQYWGKKLRDGMTTIQSPPNHSPSQPSPPPPTQFNTTQTRNHTVGWPRPILSNIPPPLSIHIEHKESCHTFLLEYFLN